MSLVNIVMYLSFFMCTSSLDPLLMSLSGKTSTKSVTRLSSSTAVDFYLEHTSKHAFKLVPASYVILTCCVGVVHLTALSRATQSDSPGTGEKATSLVLFPKKTGTMHLLHTHHDKMWPFFVK